jgi:hypothetical protein
MRQEASPLTEAAEDRVRSGGVACDGCRVASWRVRRSAPGWPLGGCASSASHWSDAAAGAAIEAEVVGAFGPLVLRLG